MWLGKRKEEKGGGELEGEWELDRMGSRGDDLEISKFPILPSGLPPAVLQRMSMCVLEDTRAISQHLE